MAFRPSVVWTVAFTGHTDSHGALPHCWQATGMAVSAPASVKYRSMRIQSSARPFAIWSRPTTGMLFSARQAITQALQPMQRDVSIAILHWYTPSAPDGVNGAGEAPD